MRLAYLNFDADMAKEVVDVIRAGITSKPDISKEVVDRLLKECNRLEDEWNQTTVSRIRG